MSRPLAAILASAALLTGVLGWLVADRVRLLATGREIVLTIRPVDPRDLFKGDFARLAFDISRLDDKVAGQPEPGSAVGVPTRLAPETVYVTLERQPDGSWKPVAAAPRHPGPTPESRIVLKGRTQAWDRRQVSYGIERYFVPEGTGGNIEELARNSKLAAIVAVDRTGNAAIKGLVVDGRRIYEEPLF